MKGDGNTLHKLKQNLPLRLVLKKENNLMKGMKSKKRKSKT